jgi:hypothetical protein
VIASAPRYLPLTGLDADEVLFGSLLGVNPDKQNEMRMKTMDNKAKRDFIIVPFVLIRILMAATRPKPSS